MAAKKGYEGIGALLARPSIIAKYAEPYSKTLKPHDAGRHFIQFIDYDSAISRDHLYAACINASVAFSEGTNIARSIGMEVLLFIAMTKQISEAIRIAGAKEGRRFIILCDDEGLYKPLERSIPNAKDFFTNKNASSIASSYGVSGSTASIMEKMAASRLF